MRVSADVAQKTVTLPVPGGKKRKDRKPVNSKGALQVKAPSFLHGINTHVVPLIQVSIRRWSRLQSRLAIISQGTIASVLEKPNPT